MSVKEITYDNNYVIKCGSLNVQSDLTVGGSLDLGSLNLQDLTITGSQNATSETTGALQVAGGMGVVQDLYVGGTLTCTDIVYKASEIVTNTEDSTSLTTGALQVAGGAAITKALNIGGALSIYNTTPATSYDTGSLIVGGGSSFASDAFFGGDVTVAGSIKYLGTLLTSTAESTSITTGCLVLGGGVGIAKKLNVGGYIEAPGLTLTEANASTSATTGDLVVAGGIGIGNNVHVVGNVVVNGYTDTKSLRITSSGNSTSVTTGALTLSGGLGVSQDVFIGGITNITTTTANQLTLGHDAANYVTFNVDSGGDLGIDASGNNVNFLNTDVITILNTAAASSTSSGVVQVKGGVGIGKNLRVGGQSSIISTTATQLTLGYNSSNTVGFNVTSGGDLSVDCSGNDFSFANTDLVGILATTQSTTTSQGSLVVGGGVGIGKNLNVGGILSTVSNYAGNLLKYATANTWYQIYEHTGQNYDGSGSTDIGIKITVDSRYTSQNLTSLVIYLYQTSNASHYGYITNPTASNTAIQPDIVVYKDNAASNTTVKIYVRWVTTASAGLFNCNFTGSPTMVRYATQIGTYVSRGTGTVPDNITVNDAVYLTNKTSTGVVPRGPITIDETNVVISVNYGANAGNALATGHGTNDCCSNGSIIVAVPTIGYNQIYYSYDGISWYLSPSTINAASVVGCTYNWNTGVFCANGYLYCYLSTDGINWTEYSSLLGNSNYAYNSPRRMIYDGQKFYGVNSAIASSTVFYSYDGITWSDCVCAAGFPIVLADIDCDIISHTYIAISSNNNMTEYVRSTDGINFTKINGLPADIWRGIGYGAGVWLVASGTNSLIYRSLDNGLTFSLVHTSTAPLILNQPYYYNPKGRHLEGGTWFVCSDASGDNLIYSLSNGDVGSWVNLAGGSFQIRAVLVHQGRFICGRGVVTPYYIDLHQEAFNVIGNTEISGSLNSGEMHSGSLLLDGNYTSTSPTNGSLQVFGGAGFNNNVNIGGILKVYVTTESTSATTGCIQVAGGLGVSKNLICGGAIGITSSTQSTSSTTGCIQVAGGVGIKRDLWVGGTIHGGIDGVISPVAPLTITGPVTYQFRLQYDVSTSSTFGVDSGGGLNIDCDSGLMTVTPRTKINSAADASSSSTGAVTVAGGIGCGGKSFFGNATESTSSITGAIILSGGMGVSKNLYIGGTTNISGITTILNSAVSSGTSTGALLIGGGVGIAGTTWCSGLNIVETTVTENFVGIASPTFVCHYFKMNNVVTCTFNFNGTLGAGITDNVVFAVGAPVGFRPITNLAYATSVIKIGGATHVRVNVVITTAGAISFYDLEGHTLEWSAGLYLLSPVLQWNLFDNHL